MFKITPFILAIWFMDCGCIKKKANMRISTMKFSYAENKLLQAALKINFGIRSKICEYPSKNKKCYYLSFNKKNSIILSDLIDEYIIPSMKYKLINRSPETARQTRERGDDTVRTS